MFHSKGSLHAHYKLAGVRSGMQPVVSECIRKCTLILLANPQEVEQ